LYIGLNVLNHRHFHIDRTGFIKNFTKCGENKKKNVKNAFLKITKNDYNFALNTITSNLKNVIYF